MAASELLAWVAAMRTLKGSDMYLTFGAPPTVRHDGGFAKVSEVILDDRMLNSIVNDLTTSDQQSAFNVKREFNMALDLNKHGRYRINILMQRGHPALVIRRITTRIPTLDELGLPVLLGQLCCEKRGLVIMVGSTGSGKSTSLAAMIDYKNRTEEGHILTIEDPLEYVHEHKKCIVTQREIGVDTESWENALVNALRQKPDVILVGEIRDAYVMRQALNIAETGHLALSTLHANNADQAIERIASFFPLDERRQIMLNLSFNLRGMLSQRLVRTVDAKRAVALEIMLGRGRIPELIRDGDTKSLKAEIAARTEWGMQTFDQNLLKLVTDGRISHTTALSESDDRTAMQTALDQANSSGENAS